MPEPEGEGRGDPPGAGRDVRVGQLLLERYRIAELIAEGGHSLVYRVEDERLGRSACAKVFHVDDLDSQLTRAVEACFVQEASFLSQLAHPNTVRLFDFGYLPAGPTAERGTPFQISELVPGGPMSRLVKKRGGLSARETLALVVPIGRALAEAHAGGVVHLDVKPRNILILPTRAELVPKLGDFGIARRLAPPPVESDKLMFSVNWAAPEQLVGDPVGPASDVYALALVAVYALCARLPFTETEVSAAYRARKQAGPLLAGLLEGVGLPRAAIAILQQACSFDPAQRTTDVLELLRQLEATLGAPPPLLATDLGAGDGLPMAGAESGPVATGRAHRLRGVSLTPIALREPSAAVLGRRLHWVEVDGEGDVSPDGNLRVRLSFVPSSGERPGLQVRGLNCFVSASGGRPSAAVTLDGNAPIELVSPRGEPLVRAEVAFATAGPVKTVVTVGEQCLFLASATCRHLVALDFGPGGVCALAYQEGSAA